MSDLHRWLEETGSGHLATRRSGAPGIAPFERFVAPFGLSGQEGIHRCVGRCEVAVEDDWSAIEWWITRTSPTEGTAASRRAAAEKLLNWACFQRGKALSSFDERDFADFARFLSDPRPVERWIAGSRTERDSKDWRPFRRVLSPASCRSVMHHVSSLVKWMALERYANLHFANGRKALRDGHSLLAIEEVGRHYADPEASLSVDEWVEIRHTLDELFPSAVASSHRLIIELMYYGGFFIEDVAKLSFSDLEPPNRVAPCWMVRRTARRPSREEVLFAPPPLSATLARWVGNRVLTGTGYLYFSYNPAPVPLLSIDSSRVRAQAIHVIREAARLALEQGKVSLGLRLRDRSTRAFRLAFEHHLRPGTPTDQAQYPLTGNCSKGGDAELDKAFGMRFKAKKQPPPWDWSHAAWLWTDGGTRHGHSST